MLASGFFFRYHNHCSFSLLFACRRSTVVVQSIRNRQVVGSIPTAGSILSHFQQSLFHKKEFCRSEVIQKLPFPLKFQDKSKESCPHFP